MPLLPNLLYQQKNATFFQLMVLQETFMYIYDNYFNKSLTIVHGNTEEMVLNAILTTGLPLQINTVKGKVTTSNLLILDGVEWDNDLRPAGRALILTQNNNIKHWEDWLSILWKASRFVDAVIMSINDTIVFSSFFPFDKSSRCGNLTNIVIVPITELYPIKFNGNLHRCDIRIISEWIMPYVRKDGDNSDPGIENMIFNVILSKLNGSAREIPLPIGENAQNSHNIRGELIGGMKKAKMQEVDIMFSGFTYRPQHYGLVDMLTPHTIDRLVWFVPAPQPLAGPSYLYFAFTWEVWLAVGTVLILTAIAGIISKSTTLLTDVTSITLNLQVSKNISKVFYLFCFFYSLHITTFYQSSLFTLFSTSIFEKPLSTLDEAADANLVTHIFNYHKPLINLSDYSLWKKLLAKTDYRDRHNPATFALERNFLLLVQNNPVRFYIETIPIYDKYGPALYQIPLQFLMCPVMFYMSKGNPLKNKVDYIIQKLVDGGLVHKWQKKFDPSVLANKGGLGSNNSKLSMFHLSGAFGCLITGILIFAPIVLGLEIATEKLLQKLNKKSKISKKRGRRERLVIASNNC